MPMSIEQHANGPRQSQRIEEQRRASVHIVNMALMAKIMAKVKEPATLEESSLANPNWKDAIQVEFDNIMKNESWELVELEEPPPNRKIIGTKWV